METYLKCKVIEPFDGHEKGDIVILNARRFNTLYNREKVDLVFSDDPMIEAEKAEQQKQEQAAAKRKTKEDKSVTNKRFTKDE